MAHPVTMLQFGPDDNDARIAEWYHGDGAVIQKGEAVYRLENDFAAVEVEAESDGVLRQLLDPGRQAPGTVIAFITNPGELLPGEELPPPMVAEAPRPKAKPRGDRRGAYARAEVLRAAAEKVTAASAGPDEAVPWEEPPPIARGEPPPLLFPRIVNELKEQAEHEAELDASEALEMADDPEPPTRIHTSAWDLVPGEIDFNPSWIMERSEESPPEASSPARQRFQASAIRSLALGREEPTGDSSSNPPEGVEATGGVDRAPSPAMPAPIARKSDPFKPVHREPPPVALQTEAASETLPPAAAGPRVPLELPSLERRGDYMPGPALTLGVTVDVAEAAKMRDQLTREWWGSNVRPTDEDIVLRAIARALHESSAFRRRTDLVGMRPLAGGTRTVHLLADAATRPFRDAVASLAALRETAGAEMPCTCTLTSFAELDLDEATPALPDGQPLAFAMGAVRDIARYRGDRPYRCQVMSLTLAYDSDAMPDGAAARLLSRVRELVEAPYALLAD